MSFIKYLRTLGYDVTNDIFAENARYFRNALVRANYNDLKNDIHATTEYLELFLRNLLLNENNTLSNRSMHVSHKLDKKVDIQASKGDIDDQKVDIECICKDILNNKIKLNKQSFLSFYSKIKDIENKLSTYTIGISNDGCVVVQYDDIQKYIYVKFFYEDNIFYNLYAKRNKLFDLVRTGTFKDLDTDYEKLCTVVA